MAARGVLCGRSMLCSNGLSRELLSWPLPLRMQGEAGRWCSRFELILEDTPPQPSLPSQGREPELHGPQGVVSIGEAVPRLRGGRLAQDGVAAFECERRCEHGAVGNAGVDFSVLDAGIHALRPWVEKERKSPMLGKNVAGQ